VPERGYTNVNAIRQEEAASEGATPYGGQEGGQEEFSIGVSAFGFGIGVSW
jgi:hypothetical protein